MQQVVARLSTDSMFPRVVWLAGLAVVLLGVLLLSTRLLDPSSFLPSDASSFRLPAVAAVVSPFRRWPAAATAAATAAAAAAPPPYATATAAAVSAIQSHSPTLSPLAPSRSSHHHHHEAVGAKSKPQQGPEGKQRKGPADDTDDATPPPRSADQASSFPSSSAAAAAAAADNDIAGAATRHPASSTPVAGRLLFVSVHGFGSQVLGVAKAIAVANWYNRSLVVPPLLSSQLMDPHTAFFSMTGVTGPVSSARMRIRFDLERVVQYERYYQFVRIWPNATSYPMMMLSDFIRQYGPEHECWDGLTVKPEQPPYINTNATVLCVGRAHSLKLGRMDRKPIPIHKWLKFDGTLVREAQHWLTAQHSLNRSSFTCVHFRAGDFQQYLGARYVSLSGLMRVMQAKNHSLSNNTLVITDSKEADDMAKMQRMGWTQFDASSLSVPKELPILRKMKLQVLEQLLCQQAHIFVGCEASSFSQLITTMMQCEYDDEHCFNYCYR